MRSFTCVSVVVYVARKLRPCPSYSRRRDRINLVLWRSLDKGGGVHARVSFTSPFWGVIRVAYPKAWYLMSNPL